MGKPIYIQFAVFACIFLAGCSTAKIHDTGKHREQIPVVRSALPESDEEGSNAWITLRKAPVKEAEGRYVYLTFDDGPSTNTDKILDILSEFQIKGTFFILGKKILDNDYMDYEDAVAALQRVLAEGHFVGLHSMTHDMHSLYKTPEAHNNFYDEMRELQKLIFDLSGGYETNLYRAPYGTRGMFTGNHIRKMANSDMKAWDWNIDTEDWKTKSTDVVLKKIKEDMEGHKYPNLVVILFHEYDVTVETLPSAIRYFLDLGYTFLPYHPDNHFQMNLLHRSEL